MLNIYYIHLLFVTRIMLVAQVKSLNTKNFIIVHFFSSWYRFSGFWSIACFRCTWPVQEGWPPSCALGVKAKMKPKLAPRQAELLGEVTHLRKFLPLTSIPLIAKKSCPRVQFPNFTLASTSYETVCLCGIWISFSFFISSGGWT